MGYIKIKEESLLAWNEFQQFLPTALYSFYDGQFGCWESTEEGSRHFVAFNDRDLYDYFDSVGIFVSVNRIYHGEILGKWYYSTKLGRPVSKTTMQNGEMNTSDAIYKTRSEAETAAFIRAFQIRNEQLSK